MFSEVIAEKLRPWQRHPAQHLLELLRRGQNCVDLSDCGCGKTWVACSVAAALGGNVLAVVPKISISAWHRVAETVGASLQAVGYEALRTGRTNFGQWENQPPKGHKAEETFICESCQCVVDFKDYRRCHCHSAGLHCVKIKRKPWKYGKFVWADNFSMIILDEGQRVSGVDSMNADLLIAARRQNIRTLGLSATLATSPLQFRAWGFSLGLFDNPDSAFYSWARRHGCGRIPNLPGFHWLPGAERKKEIMANINAAILPRRGVRVRTEDIPDFPERQIITQLYDIPNPHELDAAYAEATPEHPLTEILRARQRAELLKLDLLVELAGDELAKGNSCAIFVCFRATLDELRKRLQQFNPGVVDGSPEGVAGRDSSISSFQANDSRLILLNNAAGGVSVSLQDLTGEHPRVGLVSPSFSATEFRQVCGRLHRAGGKSKCLYRVVLAANTVEEKIFKALKQKEGNLDALCDGDLTISSA